MTKRSKKFFLSCLKLEMCNYFFLLGLNVLPLLFMFADHVLENGLGSSCSSSSGSTSVSSNSSTGSGGVAGSGVSADPTATQPQSSTPVPGSAPGDCISPSSSVSSPPSPAPPLSPPPSTTTLHHDHSLSLKSIAQQAIDRHGLELPPVTDSTRGKGTSIFLIFT